MRGLAVGVAKVGVGRSAVDVLKMEIHLLGYLLPFLPSDLSGSFSARRRHMGPVTTRITRILLRLHMKLRLSQSTSGNHVVAVNGGRVVWSPPSVEWQALISS